MLKECCRRSDEKIVTEVMKKIVVEVNTHPNISTTCKFQINIKKKDILNEDILCKTNFEF